MDLQEAIDAPAWHTTGFPASFYPRDDRARWSWWWRTGSAPACWRRPAGARARGARSRDAWSLGRLCAVTRDPATGVLAAAANPRGMQGYACGR